MGPNVSEPFDHLPLFRGQAFRRADVQHHSQIAADAGFVMRKAAIREYDDVSALSAWFDDYVDVAIKGGEVNGIAEYGVRHADIQRADQIIALAREEPVRLDFHCNIKVSGFAAPNTGIAIRREMKLFAG